MMLIYIIKCFFKKVIKKVILLGMPIQTAFQLLYDDSYITLNRKNEQVKKHIITINTSKYKSIKKNYFFIFFICTLKIMESTSQNNSINAIKEARKIFNEVRSTLSREEINEI